MKGMRRATRPFYQNPTLNRITPTFRHKPPFSLRCQESHTSFVSVVVIGEYALDPPMTPLLSTKQPLATYTVEID